VNGDLFGRQAVPLAAVRHGSTVLDVRGAPVGRVEYVGIGHPDEPLLLRDGTAQVDDPLWRVGFVKVHGYGPGARDFIVTPGQIAYVADDHVRLSVAADDATLSADPL